MGIRKIATNKVILNNGRHIVLGLVVIENGAVRNVERLNSEQANTEWLEGTIELISVGEEMQAWHNGKRLS